jgi:transitional endoplasmic reticulum ATPase
MNAIPALVRPRLASTFDIYAALWVTRLCIKMPIAFRQLNTGVFSEELRGLIGIQPEYEKLNHGPTVALLKQRVIELENRLPKHPSRLAQNVCMLGELLELDETQCDVLFFVAVCNENAYLSDFVENLHTASLRAILRIFSIALEAQTAAIKRALRPDGNLLGTRVLKFQQQRSQVVGQLMMPEGLHNALFSNADSLEQLMATFLEPAPKPKLSGNAFPHLDAETKLLTNYIGNSRGSGMAGINVLTFGVPGTGKTEYVRWFAAQLGKPLFQVKACDDQGRPFSGLDRLGFFLISQRFLHKSDVLILFDEIEDVFPTTERGYDFDEDIRRAAPGKMFINKVLESNTVPTFWVTLSLGKAYCQVKSEPIPIGLSLGVL